MCISITLYQLLYNIVAGSMSDVVTSPVPHPGLKEAQEVLAALSKQKKVQPRRRKAEPTVMSTSCPSKKMLLDKAAGGGGPESKRRLSVSRPKPSKGKSSKKATSRKKAESSKRSFETDETPCCICSRKCNEPPFEDWLKCGICGQWYHESCGPDDEAICYNCVA